MTIIPSDQLPDFMIWSGLCPPEGIRVGLPMDATQRKWNGCSDALQTALSEGFVYAAGRTKDGCWCYIATDKSVGKREALFFRDFKDMAPKKGIFEKANEIDWEDGDRTYIRFESDPDFYGPMLCDPKSM